MVIREIDVDWLDSGADFPGLETWTPARHRAGSVNGLIWASALRVASRACSAPVWWSQQTQVTSRGALRCI